MSEPNTPLQPCPTCGGAMRWAQNRTNRSWFMGCRKWPTCNGTRTPEGTNSVISSQSQNRLLRMLKAAVLASEDECLTFSDAQLRRADAVTLDLTEITEDKGYILTVVKEVKM